MGDRTILDALMEGDLSVLDGIRFPEAPPPAPGALGYVQQAGSSLLQGAASQTGEMLRGAGTLIGAVPGVDGGPSFPQAAYNVNEALPTTMEESAKAIIPDVPGARGSFLADTLPRAMGSITPYLAGGGVASLARLPPALAAAASGALASGSAGFYEAKYKGADEATQWKSYWLNAMAGTSNALEVARIFSRIDKASGGMLRRLLVDAPIGGVVEGVQEAGTQGASNLIAKHLYDPERELLSGVAESGGAGFLTAVILEAVTPGRGNGRADVADVPQDAATGADVHVDVAPIPGMPEPAPQPSAANVELAPDGSARVDVAPAEAQAHDALGGPALTPSLEASATASPVEAPPAPATDLPESVAGVSRTAAPSPETQTAAPVEALTKDEGAATTPRGIKHADTLAERGTDRVARETKADADLHARAKAKLDEDPFAGQRLVGELENANRPHTDEEGTLLGLELTRLANERDAAQKAYIAEPTPENQKRIDESRAAYGRASTVSDLAGSETGAALRNRRLRFARDYSLAQMEREVQVAKGGEALTKPESDRVAALHDRMAKAESDLSALEIRQGEIELERQLTRIENEARRSVRKTSRTQRVAEIDREIDTLVRGIGRKLQTTTGANLGNVAAVVPDIAKVAKLFIEKGSLKFQDFHDAMTKALGENVRPHLAAAWDQARTEHRDELLGPAVTKMRKGESARADLEGIARTFMERGVSRPSVVDQVHRAVAEIAPDITREQVVEGLQERRLKAFKTRQASGAKEAKAAARDQDFGPRSPEELKLDEEALTLKTEREKARREFEREKLAFERENRTTAKKVLDRTAEVLNLPRAIWSSYDLSAVLRQGGFFSLGHPVQAVRHIRQMLKAAKSEDYAIKLDVKLRERPLGSLGDRAGLDLTFHGDTIGKHEEAIRSELSDRIPGVKLSNRAFTSYMNLQRAAMFDRMVLGAPDGHVDLAQAKEIARFVNIATGRGTSNPGKLVSTILWSPKLLQSRFQLIAEPIRQAYPGRDMYVRRAIAEQYVRTLLGLTAVYAGAAMLGADIEKDPRSSDFGKLRFGDVRLDPLAGVSQATVLLSRIGSGSVKTLDGKVNDLRFEDMTRFLRSKLSPAIGMAVDLRLGKNVVGEEVTPQSTARDALIPLSFRDIYEVMREQGVPEATAFSILSIFGWSLQSFESKKKPEPRK